jgi:hypothetical protein
VQRAAEARWTQACPPDRATAGQGPPARPPLTVKTARPARSMSSSNAVEKPWASKQDRPSMNPDALELGSICSTQRCSALRWRTKRAGDFLPGVTIANHSTLTCSAERHCAALHAAGFHATVDWSVPISRTAGGSRLRSGVVGHCQRGHRGAGSDPSARHRRADRAVDAAGPSVPAALLGLLGHRPFPAGGRPRWCCWSRFRRSPPG